MTKRRAEHLTGYDIRRLSAGEHPVTVGAFNGEDLVAKARNLTERLSVEGFGGASIPSALLCRAEAVRRPVLALRNAEAASDSSSALPVARGDA